MGVRRGLLYSVNRDETRRVLREMAAAYRAELTDDQVVVWAATIGRFDLPVALETARVLRETKDGWPTHNQFVATAQAVLRRRAASQPQLPQEALPTLSEMEQRRRTARRYLDEIKGKLREQRAC